MGMELLHIEKTESTPLVHLDPDSGEFLIQGESFPENAAKFYTPIIEWFKSYLLSPADHTCLEIEILYFNSSTSKVFLTIFDMMDKEVQSGKDIRVIWKCDPENESIIEFGEEFKEDLIALPFDIMTE